MKIAKGFILRTVKGADNEEKYVVITVGEAAKKLNGMITLNETCAFIWKLLETPTTIDEVVTAVANEYNVSKEEVENDVISVIEGLKKQGCIDD